MTKFCSTFLATIAFGFSGLPQAHGQDPKIASEVTAIDILLAPDRVMLDRARSANALLRADYRKGFALDATHAPASPSSRGSFEPAS